MLNRQTVKNVTIPLYPGEMKVKAIDASMLQVARRGESVYGAMHTDMQRTCMVFGLQRGPRRSSASGRLFSRLSVSRQRMQEVRGHRRRSLRKLLLRKHLQSKQVTACLVYSPV